MKDFAYVLITPYSLHKSRTGAILARLLSGTSLDLCCVEMFAPSNEMIDEYIESIHKGSLSHHNKELVISYVDRCLRPNTLDTISNRCMLLVFKGKDATNVIRRVVGHVTHKPKGDTVRGAYGDYIIHGDSIIYFEPAVLCASDENEETEQLKIFQKYSDTDGGVITSALNAYTKERDDYQITLVMLKPDMFKEKSSRPGNIIDIFSKTGLYIVGSKLVNFSIAQANEFYGPLKEIFKTKLEKKILKFINELLLSKLPYKLEDQEIKKLIDIFREKNAEFEFNQIVEYITGKNPKSISESEYLKPGEGKCLVLLYYGINAISKIRDMLGATNPMEAKGGTVRSEFGQNILKNGAHGSDSPENAQRERKIVGLVGNEPSELKNMF